MFLFWRKKKVPTLRPRGEKLDVVMGELDDSRRAFKEGSARERHVFSPSEEWSKKYLSQGIGPEAAYGAPIVCFEDGTCLPPRDELMRELAARVAAADGCGCIGTRAMRRPFAYKKTMHKRPWLLRLLSG
ncbi:MAG: hypothetical protein ACT4OG_00985 [Alphaproteobacteria bacterium]